MYIVLEHTQVLLISDCPNNLGLPWINLRNLESDPVPYIKFPKVALKNGFHAYILEQDRVSRHLWLVHVWNVTQHGRYVDPLLPLSPKVLQSPVSAMRNASKASTVRVVSNNGG